MPIRTPPLRERPEDIPTLIHSFLDHFAATHGKRRKRLDAEALELCRRFPWPGNVRQLRNLVERLVVTCPDAEIGVKELPEFVTRHGREASEFSVRVGMTLAEVERLLIQRTLSQATSHRGDAARLLGISRRGLQYKLRAHGLLDR